VLAAYSNDVLKSGLTAIGLERSSNFYLDPNRGVYIIFPGSMPWSHSLFMTVVWSLMAAGIAYLFYHNRRISSIFGLVVMSHWLLDFLVHPPELPLFFGQSPIVGLGLWIAPSTTVIANIIEAAMLAGSSILYFNKRIKIYYRSG
jgi:membrane-bound metal-dependent hydrolase YbcI (DUF457 family)